MYPELCKFGPITVYSYGFMLIVAFLASSSLAISEAKRQNFNPDTVFNLLFTGFIFGIIGARIFYVIENIDFYLKDPIEIILLNHGGLSWFGGLFMGLVSCILYLRNKRLPFYKTADLIIPFLALGQAIGRAGCLLNGCCYGKPSISGIYFPVHDAVLIPTQTYSSLALILIYIILRMMQARPHKEGTVLFAYLMLYSIKRFIIEFWRADNDIILSGLTLFQIISLAVFFLAFFKYTLIIKSRR